MDPDRKERPTNNKGGEPCEKRSEASRGRKAARASSEQRVLNTGTDAGESWRGCHGDQAATHASSSSLATLLSAAKTFDLSFALPLGVVPGLCVDAATDCRCSCRCFFLGMGVAGFDARFLPRSSSSSSSESSRRGLLQGYAVRLAEHP